MIEHATRDAAVRQRPPRRLALANTHEHYGAVAIGLHWLMAALLVVLVLLGLYMAGLPDAGFDKRKIVLVLTHKELGVYAFALASLRLAWRVGNALPSLVESMPEWQQVLARLVHLCFYALMFALPLSGWLMSSATDIPVTLFFGHLELPDLVRHDEPLFRLLMVVHRWLAYALIACFAVHAGAALAHHLMWRDDTLKKMLPGDRD
jgi:cytochrome b561